MQALVFISLLSIGYSSEQFVPRDEYYLGFFVPLITLSVIFVLYACSTEHKKPKNREFFGHIYEHTG